MKANKMDIQLKQSDIEKAVRAYVIEKIGINMQGKLLHIDFSMKRGEQGLVASLTIDDVSNTELPGYTDRPADPEPVQTVATVIDITAAALGAAPAEQPQTVTLAATTEAKEEPEPTPAPEPEILAEDPALTEVSVPAEAFGEALAEAPVEAEATEPAAEEAPKPTIKSLFRNN